jgi:hypothetical protein
MTQYAVWAFIVSSLTAPAFSFPFHFFRKAFFASRLSRWPHELVPHLHPFRINTSP